MACSQTDAAGHASLEQGTDDAVRKQRMEGRDAPYRAGPVSCACLSRKDAHELFAERYANAQQLSSGDCTFSVCFRFCLETRREAVCLFIS